MTKHHLADLAYNLILSAIRGIWMMLHSTKLNLDFKEERKWTRLIHEPGRTQHKAGRSHDSFQCKPASNQRVIKGWRYVCSEGVSKPPL